MQESLKLGCLQRSDKLLMPAMAELVYATSADSDGDVALVDLVVRSKPEATAPVLRLVKMGAVLRRVAYDTPPGWTTVWVDEQEGFVRTDEVRSPYDFQMELTRDGDRWLIHEYGVGV